MRTRTAHLVFAVEEEVALRESQGFKVSELTRAQQLAEEHKSRIVQKWHTASFGKGYFDHRLRDDERGEQLSAKMNYIRESRSRWFVSKRRRLALGYRLGGGFAQL